jgi:dienelactone hydrolase
MFRHVALIAGCVGLALLVRSAASMAATNAAEPVVFASTTPGLRLSGLLYRPASTVAPAIVIVSGTSGAQGFQNWEVPWAQRLQRAGYVALIVDSFTPRGLAFAEHWRLSAALRGRDTLDAAAFLRRQPYVRTTEIGAIGRSGGGSALLSAIVERAGPAHPVPFRMAAVDYGYCQRPYGDWQGGTTANRAAHQVYRTSTPLLITLGTLDTHVPVASCIALVSSARSAGMSVTLKTYAGAEHAFDTLYGDGTPAQQADIVNTIAAFIANYVAPAPSGVPIRVNPTALQSNPHSQAGEAIVVRMQGPGSAFIAGSVTLTQRAGGVVVALNLAEGTPRAVAQIRQGSCAQIYPEVAYRIGGIVNGTASAIVPNVRLSHLMNGHFAIVVALPEADVTEISACADIPSTT